MNDKTLGEYKRTTPDPDETTGEALARLQAELTRLLDEADAELRDDMDGGVAAALIEKEAEKPAAEVRELRSALAREIARGNALQDALDAAVSRPLTPDAMTAREHLEAAMKGGLTREDIPNDMCDRLVASRADTVRRPTAPGDEYPRRGVRDDLLAALTEPPARPEGAEELGELIGTWTASEDIAPAQLPTGSLATLADFLAQRGVRVVSEDGAR